MDLGGRIMPPIGPGTVKGGRRIVHHQSFKPKIARHARRDRDTVVGRKPDDNERIDAVFAEMWLKISADKGAVHPFLKKRLACERNCLRLDFTAGIFGIKRGTA